MRTERVCPATWYVDYGASAWRAPCSFLLGSATF